ncbi:hypothetical protein H6784_01285 [Candidatus Nomurabacteria bacterium]|nr:hypothetical protein [Candidatus Nomurabacteria bacterium]
MVWTVALCVALGTIFIAVGTVVGATISFIPGFASSFACGNMTMIGCEYPITAGVMLGAIGAVYCLIQIISRRKVYS